MKTIYDYIFILSIILLVGGLILAMRQGRKNKAHQKELRRFYTGKDFARGMLVQSENKEGVCQWLDNISDNSTKKTDFDWGLKSALMEYHVSEHPHQ